VKAVAVVGGGSAAILFGAAGLVAMAAAATMGGLVTRAAVPPEAPPSPTALQRIPPSMLTLYERAAATCDGLPWAVVAAIGTVESDNGRSDAPGVHSGSNTAGAEGPMQFEPATFATYSLPVPPGGVRPPSPYNPTDAVYATARDLCANGGAGGADIPAAVYAYNHSTAYVDAVLTLAATYEQAGGPTSAATGAAAIAVRWALAQVGTPYLWGRATPAASPCRGSRRTSSMPVRPCPVAPVFGPAISSSSVRRRARSPTSACTSGSGTGSRRWSTRRTPGRTSGSSPFPMWSARPGEVTCTSERPGRAEGGFPMASALLRRRSGAARWLRWAGRRRPGGGRSGRAPGRRQP
jgi:cell wall-associated NlpC family hydrolase